MTSLHLSVQAGNEQIAHKLINRGCDWKIKNAKGETAADIARNNNHVEMIEII